MPVEASHTSGKLSSIPIIYIYQTPLVHDSPATWTQSSIENLIPQTKVLELLLTFGIPLSLLSDPGTEFTAEVVQHPCKWFNVTIDYSPSDHPRVQGAAERLGGWTHETLVELASAMG